MNKIFNLVETNTSKEIYQQPKIWRSIVDLINNNQERINNFFKQVGGAKIILTGAGTSAFIGKILEPYLRNILDENEYQVQAIDTTTIVSAPLDYLKKDTKTILISFARSGNSPESVATIKLAEQIVDNLYLINITCNEDGNLYKNFINNSKALNILLPKETNDKGFAMTSSFSGMLLAALLIFHVKDLSKISWFIKMLAIGSLTLLNKNFTEVKKLADIDFKRLVYLGSSSLLGLSEEASLKFLELTQGKIPTMFNSSLGFRHGPKSILNNETLVVVFVSSNSYTQKYDIDIIKELYNEPTETRPIIAVISEAYSEKLKGLSDYYFYVHDVTNRQLKHDVFNSFNFILYAQLLALFKSIQLGINPDNPCKSGSVNRVVKGVKVYKL